MTQSPLFKLSVRYAVVAGVMSCILVLVIYYAGRHPLLVSPFLDFRVLLFAVFIFFALKEFRDFKQNRVLYFWQGLLGSLLIISIASVVGAIGLYIFGSMESQFVTDYITEMTSYLKTFPKEDIERIGKDVYERNLSLLPSTNISSLAITYLFQGIAIGFFISIILSVILRKLPKT